MANRLSLVLITALALAGAAAAETPQAICARLATGNSASATYARRGGYCDGSLRENQSGSGELAVIGVMATPIAGSPAVKPLLIGVLSDASTGPVQLQGVAKRWDLNYRLDAALSRQPLKIGAESAMNRIQLKAEDVAWAAWSDLRTGRIYVPVVASGSAPRGLEIIVRPTFAAGYLVYSIRTPAGFLKKDAVLKGTSTPGAPVTLLVDGGEPRLITVEITAVAEDGETQVASIQVLRPGAAR
jgi:hypothetical protein